MADDDESWRDVKVPAFPADMLFRANPRVKRVKVEPTIKSEPDIKVELDIEDEPDSGDEPDSEDEQDVEDEQEIEDEPDIKDGEDHDAPAYCPSSPSASSSCPRSPSSSSPIPSSPIPSSPIPSSPPPSWPEPPETKTEGTVQPKCRWCEEPAVLKYTSDLNPINAGRPYFICPSCPGDYRWVCWADQVGVSAENPTCYCQASSRLVIIRKESTGKFGRGFWTCVKGKCDYYSENLDGEPGVSFDGGFYPEVRVVKRKYSE